METRPSFTRKRAFVELSLHIRAFCELSNRSLTAIKQLTIKNKSSITILKHHDNKENWNYIGNIVCSRSYEVNQYTDCVSVKSRTSFWCLVQGLWSGFIWVNQVQECPPKKSLFTYSLHQGRVHLC